MIPADSLVSVITVNYNGWRDTCEMIASFRKHETYPYEMIVVDNASSGDDADRIGPYRRVMSGCQACSE